MFRVGSGISASDLLARRYLNALGKVLRCTTYSWRVAFYGEVRANRMTRAEQNIPVEYL